MVGKSVKGALKSKKSQPSPPTLATESYGYALTGTVECLSANHPPVAPLRLQAYRGTARSLGYSSICCSISAPSHLAREIIGLHQTGLFIHPVALAYTVGGPHCGFIQPWLRLVECHPCFGWLLATHAISRSVNKTKTKA